MRRIVLALALMASCVPLPAFAADPAPIVIPAGMQASDADFDRLFKAMDMQSMMDGMMAQMVAAQQAMIAESFGKDLSDADRARMQGLLAKTDPIILKHLSWAALEPTMRKIYAQVFTKREVDAMVAFYSTPEGASMLKKMPQAMALSLQEMQPIVRDTMAEVKAMIDEETAAPASKRPRP